MKQLRFRRLYHRLTLCCLCAALITSGMSSTEAVRLTIKPGASNLASHARAQDNSSSEADIIRFLEQATFGATEELINHVQAIGFKAFLEEQYNAPISPYPNLAPWPAQRPETCTGTCVRDNYTMYPLQVRFFSNALNGQDQLRQRVAFALSQILVVSGVQIRQPSSMAPYLNLLTNEAFDNYRQILYDMTLNPAMGDYLDMVNNDKANATGTIQPNENYAREVLQLFSIGVNLLNQDGTPQLDTQGQPIPAYTQEMIEGFAHAFTGWTYAAQSGQETRAHNPPYYLAPMQLYRDRRGVDLNHDKGAKELLSYPGALRPTLSPNQDGQVDLNQAIDNIFYHPNVGPFISKQLIQHLVTSNPSPAYVSRVAAAFNNNGLGVRGEMKAVINAILFDPEARGDLKTDADYGHLREPALFITNLCRALNATSDGILNDASRTMGQDLFNSPSVFNYYPHQYTVPGTNTQGPEFGIESTSTALARTNFVNTLIFGGLRLPAPATGTALNLSGLQFVAGNPATLTSVLDRLLLHYSMSAAMRSAIINAVSAIPASQPLQRAQTALYLVAASPQYQVQR